MKPRNLVVRSPNWLGDACMAVPAVRAIKWAHPEARLSVLAPEGLVDLWDTVGEVDAVVAKGRSDAASAVARKLHEWDFDTGVLLTNSFRSALELFLARIPQRIGFRGQGRRFLLSRALSEPAAGGATEHQSLIYLRLARAIGASDEVIERAIQSRRPAQERAPRSGGVSRAKLGICAGARYGRAKQWPLERFAATAEKVRMRVNCEWLLFGGADEMDDGRMLQGMMGGDCVNLTGATTLAQLMSHLRDCRLLLTNDTGTMHLADFLGVPTVAIFGSTDPAKTGPSGAGHRVMRNHVECSPCFLRECPIDFRCMRGVEVDDVVGAVVEALRS